MNKICIKNGTVISMDEKRAQKEENMDILISDGLIVKIAKGIDAPGAKIIDATNKIVMPGLINTHAHVPMSIFRETLDGFNLQDWLNKKIWPMEAKLNEEDIYYASMLSFIEMIETGCTTINDMYFMTDAIIKAMNDTGIRLQTTNTLMDMSGSNETLGTKRFSDLEKMISKYNNDNLTWNVGIHGLYTSSEKYVKKCLSFARKHKLLVHMHFCENDNEVLQIKQNYHKNPTEVLLSDFNNTKVLLAHAVKLTKDDITKIKTLNASISHCPVSNLKLGCGIADIKSMLDNNINVSLGTDGQGSGSSLDMFEAMKFAALLQKGNAQDPTILPAYEVIKMATINGAKALGLDDKIGSITALKTADLIILDLNNTILMPQNNVFSEIVYNAKGSNVDTTIVGGKILMENRKININKEQIYKKCESIIKRIML